MIKFFIKFIIFIATLIVGFQAARISVSFRSTPISLCEAVNNTALYDGQIVRMKVFTTGNFINEPSCGGEYGEWADVEFQKQPEYEDLMNELHKMNTADSLANAEIILTGEFEYVGPICTGSSHRINSAKIEQAGDVRVKWVNDKGN